jgi:hypothetical protein
MMHVPLSWEFGWPGKRLQARGCNVIGVSPDVTSVGRILSFKAVKTNVGLLPIAPEFFLQFVHQRKLA